MSKVMVTGAGGFVGYALADGLNKLGHDVTGAIRTVNNRSFPFKYFVHDLAHPLNLHEHFDVIVHAAANIKLNENFNSYKKDNIDSTANIVEFAKNNGVSEIIYMSAASIYDWGGGGGHINESSDITNPSYYSLTKYVGELLLGSEKQIKSLCLRLPGVVGDRTKNWLSNIVRKISNHEPVTIYSPEFKITNFVHINDLIKFVDLMIKKGISESDVLVLACQEGLKIIDIVNQIKNKLNSKSRITIDVMERQSFCLDSSKARAFGYVSMTPQEIIDDYCNTVLSSLGRPNEH